jgi:tetratricopeptide (TPR) repeat protein
MAADAAKKVSDKDSACLEWEADLRELITLARNSFSGGDFIAAVECCRKASEYKGLSDDDALAHEIYYLWCLANLKTGGLDETIKVCSDARRKLGDYLDLAYFELIVAIMQGEPESVLSLAQEYLKLWNNEKENDAPWRSRTHDRVGEVMLMTGQTLEQMHLTVEAIEIYKKYLAIFPEDKAISDRIAQMSIPGKA